MVINLNDILADVTPHVKPALCMKFVRTGFKGRFGVNSHDICYAYDLLAQGKHYSIIEVVSVNYGFVCFCWLAVRLCLQLTL